MKVQPVISPDDVAGRLRVVIGATDPSYRRELRRQVDAEPDMVVIAETEDGEEALALLRALRPSLAVLDADLASFGGSAIARIVASELPEIRVLVMK